MFTSLLYAQEATGEAAQQTAQGGGIMGFLPIIIMFVILYFLLIRPQQKNKKTWLRCVMICRRMKKSLQAAA